MHFCNKCDNMLYIRLTETDADNLIYYCRNCGETNNEIEQSNICVITENILSKDKNIISDINKYTKLDPTLPRSKNIKCPVQDCPSNNGKDSEIIYYRYDNVNMQYIYICSLCDKVWKTSEN